MSKDIRERIVKELKGNEAGFTVSELASKLKVSRHTVSNTFAYLEGADKIQIRKAGMAKIHYWKK